MIHAYDKTYLKEAMENLGNIFGYFEKYTNLEINEIDYALKKSKYIDYLVNGHPSYTSGKSGAEVFVLVCNELSLKYENSTFFYSANDKTAMYWAGWSLAYFCWYYCYDFKKILYSVSLQDILDMYYLYHEMELEHFCIDLQKKIREGTVKRNLRINRELNNLS